MRGLSRLSRAAAGVFASAFCILIYLNDGALVAAPDRVETVEVDVARSSSLASSMLRQVESGEPVSLRMGSSVWVHSILGINAEDLLEAFRSDSDVLSRLLPQLAFMSRLKDPSSRDYLYMKLRGFGSGVGALFEVEYPEPPQGNGLSLLLPSSVVKSSGLGQSEAPRQWEQRVRREIQELNSSSGLRRSLGDFQGLRLYGPLNELMEFPGVRVAIEISVAPYSVSGSAEALQRLSRERSDVPSSIDLANSGQGLTYAAVKLEFFPVPTKEQLPAVGGFLSDSKLMSVEWATKNILRSLQARAKGI